MFDDEKVKEMLAQLASDDDELGGELQERMSAPVSEAASGPRVAVLGGAAGGGALGGPPLTAETIVLRTGRPVLAIKQNDVVLEFRDADSRVWKQRLTQARDKLARPILAVGRIDLVGHPDFEWVGTGWLVRPSILATNRHVARLFARRSGDRFTFQPGSGGRPISANIDFLREFGSKQQRSFRILDVLHIEDDDGPDLALLRVAAIPDAQPIPLSTAEPRVKTQVAVIGYPARDSRIPDQDLMERLFGNVYDRKRLAPGLIKSVQDGFLLHDCTTLGGNSGSAVIELATGKALGIHFAGRFLEANFAVPAQVIEDRVRSAERPGRPAPARTPDAPAAAHAGANTTGTRKFECVIPLKVTIEVGEALSATATATVPHPTLAAGDDAGDDADFAPRSGAH